MTDLPRNVLCDGSQEPQPKNRQDHVECARWGRIGGGENNEEVTRVLQAQAG